MHVLVPTLHRKSCFTVGSLLETSRRFAGAGTGPSTLAARIAAGRARPEHVRAAGELTGDNTTESGGNAPTMNASRATKRNKAVTTRDAKQVKIDQSKDHARVAEERAAAADCIVPVVLMAVNIIVAVFTPLRPYLVRRGYAVKRGRIPPTF